MGRIHDMCDVCKLDKIQQCDYNCIKRREDFIYRFHTCPKFIHGSLLNIDDSISYHASNAIMLHERYKETVDEYIENKSTL